MQAQKHRPLVVLVLLRSEGSMENAEVIRDRMVKTLRSIGTYLTFADNLLY